LISVRGDAFRSADRKSRNASSSASGRESVDAGEAGVPVGRGDAVRFLKIFEIYGFSCFL
jgi:hypothetical protein